MQKVKCCLESRTFLWGKYVPIIIFALDDVTTKKCILGVSG